MSLDASRVTEELALPSVEKPKAKRKARRKHVKTPSETLANGFEVTRHAVAPGRTRGFVLRAFPTEDQAHRLNQLIGQGRHLWNWMLDFQETSYAQGVSLHNKAGAALLNAAITAKLRSARADAARVLTHPASPELWGEHWLADCPRTLVTQKLDDLNKSWKAFFKGTGGKPTFKSRSSRDSVRFQMDPRQHDQSLFVHFPAEAQRAQDENGDLLPFQPHYRQGRDPQDTWVKIPNVGRVRVELSEPIRGQIVTITVKRRSVCRRNLRWSNTTWAGYEIVLTANDVPIEKDRPANWAKRVDWETDALANQGPGKLGTGLGLRDPAGVVALDMSIPNRAVTSNGDVLGRRDQDPHTSAAHQRYLRRQKRDQRQASRKQRHRQREAGFGLKPGDMGYRGGSHQPVPLPSRKTWTPEQKAAMRPSGRQKVLDNQIARDRATAKRQKTHDAHVFTTALVLAFHTIVVEGLTLKGMAQSLSRAFRRGFNEAAMGEILRMLTYKCELYGRTLVVADRWFPGSKRCSNPACHQVSRDLKLSDRTWTCPHCGTHHVRDPNSTYNLWQEGCAAVGIPTGMQISPSSAGESPVAGRGGLQRWIGNRGESHWKPRSTAAREASRTERNTGLVVSTMNRTAPRGTVRRLG
jgi:IS605 OrfB family transposase